MSFRYVMLVSHEKGTIITMNTFTIIVGIIGAIVGLWIGYASYKDKDQGLAVLMGLLGAVLGAVVGVFLWIVLVVIVVLYLMLVALTYM